MRHFFLLVSIWTSLDLVHCVFYKSIKSNRLLESYNPQNAKFCQIVENGTTVGVGKCMFVWDCHKSQGENLGICILDTAIYGTCCFHNVSTTTSPSEPDYSEDNNVDVELNEVSSSSTTTAPPYSQCGVSEMETTPVQAQQKSRNSPEFRIVGGEPANVGQWPWVVSVRRASLFGYSSTHSCGGVVYNENWIVTAAHCVASLSKSLIRVRLGDLDFKSEKDNDKIPFVELKIDRKIIYPTYNFSSFENDLALLKLSKPITYSSSIRPLCLPVESDPRVYIGENGTIVGWGRISENGQYSQKQLYVQVPIISNDVCVKMFKAAGRDERIPGHFICAGYALGGKDGCQGDSGGPLTVKDSNGRWTLVGIMSWGIGCGEPQQPGVYTRITLFTDWIIQHAI